MRCSVFFSNQLNDYVVDELCKCNHLKSEHGSKISNMEGFILREPNQGSCCSGVCVCKQFKFEKFVTITEAAKIVASKKLMLV